MALHFLFCTPLEKTPKRMATLEKNVQLLKKKFLYEILSCFYFKTFRITAISAYYKIECIHYSIFTRRVPKCAISGSRF